MLFGQRKWMVTLWEKNSLLQKNVARTAKIMEKKLISKNEQNIK